MNELISLLGQSNPRGLSRTIQEWLGAASPNEGGRIEEILANRRRPGLGDWADSVAQTATSGTPISPNQIADERMSSFMERLAELQGLSGQDSSDVKTYQFYKSLPPQDQDEFLNVKRASQVINLGGRQVVRSPAGGIVEDYAVTPKPQDMPHFIADQTLAKEGAANFVENQNVVPNQVNNINNTIKVIEDALAHPGFDPNFGMTGVIPNRPGSEASNAETYINQLRGKAFLNEIPQMKGSGALSDAEGLKLEQAATRLAKAQSAASARKALEEMKTILISNRERFQQKIGSFTPLTVDQLYAPINNNLANPPALPGSQGVIDFNDLPD